MSPRCPGTRPLKMISPARSVCRVAARPSVCAAFALLTVLARVDDVCAAAFEGRLALEMEYLGESYYSEQSLSAEDLGLPPGTPIVYTDTTRFQDDLWHPGPRLDLSWRGAQGTGTVEFDSHTAFNSERLSQDLSLTGRHPAGGGSWRWGAHGGLRDEKRSLVGDGDWRAGLDGERTTRLGRGVEGALRASWEHSRTRGDTVSYLYDYDLGRVRLRVGQAETWLPAWEVLAEGSVKSVGSGQPGAYVEGRLAGTWRPRPDGDAVVDAELRGRNYRLDRSPGRDVVSGEIDARTRLRSWPSSRLDLEASVEAFDYRGEDALYFDSAEILLRVPWSREGAAWTLALGPAVARLQDLGGGSRDYFQWTARAAASRFYRITGFGEIHVEAGYRDYRAAGAGTIEITSLSGSLLRTDYWLLDALLTVNLPVREGYGVEALGTASWEFHPAEAERIQVTLITLGVTRSF